MKKLVLVTARQSIGTQYHRELQEFFAGSIQIGLLVVGQDDLSSIGQYELVLVSHYDLVSEFKPYLRSDTKVICIKKNISPAGLAKLEEIPYGSAAYVRNIGPKTCRDSIALIYSHGRTDLILYPHYPGVENEHPVDMVITQGEGPVPECAGLPLVDIFDTVLDTQIYWEIILFFHLPQDTFFRKMAEMNEVKNSVSKGFSYMVSEKMLQDNVVNTLFENLNEGVLIYDTHMIVVNCSISVRGFLGRPEEDVVGKSVFEVFPITPEQVDQGDEVLLGVHGTPLICQFVQCISLGNREVGLIILKRYDELQSKMQRHTKELIAKGHLAKYSLNDIGGSSKRMQEIKSKCLKMASTEATVLILGESGTGKEIFAHIIHENSLRSSHQFVAINCASFSETLLESELFGYDDGAFTGAKRGGKQGIFEQANGGTLFLDEIGELPLHLQNRLLRVLQEKEVVRVGGDRVIPVDVRVIAATNADLLDMVEKKTFRKDLYYRLCVLPLRLPPLRERERDCLEIFEIYCRNEGCSITLSAEVEEFFLRYGWDGNVRELRNCFEYLKYLGKTHVELEDLPEIMLMKRQPFVRPPEPECTVDLKTRLLMLLQQAKEGKYTIGRQALCRKLREEGVTVGEQAVRDSLLELQTEGLALVGKGRAGTAITESGEKYLSQNIVN